VRFQITSAGANRMKIKEYEGRTDTEGRVFFLGIPSNASVQSQIAYQLLIDYQGVRYPVSLTGFPKTVDREAFYTELDPAVRLPENRISVTLDLPAEPEPSLSQLRVNHRLIELHPDEDALVFIHDLVLENQSAQALNLSLLPGGGLAIPAPRGAKSPQLREEEKGRFEVRGSSLYFTGVIAGRGRQQVRWTYTVPYRSESFEWSLTAPVASQLNLVVAPKFKKQQHQRAFPLSLSSTSDGGEVSERQTGPGMRFDVLTRRAPISAGEPLRFRVSGLPQAGLKQRQVMYLALALVTLLLIVLSLRKTGNAGLSRAHLEGERDRLVQTIARLERALARGKITEKRYAREREAITARLVTLYRALEGMSAEPGE
ncbi:MAG: hypothetical protein VYD19_10635, partial [Myxococcota bacterium]|nr:hypothetical protein [Myxococcota bacterium]